MDYQVRYLNNHTNISVQHLVRISAIFDVRIPASYSEGSRFKSWSSFSEFLCLSFVILFIKYQDSTINSLLIIHEQVIYLFFYVSADTCVRGLRRLSAQARGVVVVCRRYCRSLLFILICYSAHGGEARRYYRQLFYTHSQLLTFYWASGKNYRKLFDPK